MQEGGTGQRLLSGVCTPARARSCRIGTPIWGAWALGLRFDLASGREQGVWLSLVEKAPDNFVGLSGILELVLLYSTVHVDYWVQRCSTAGGQSRGFCRCGRDSNTSMITPPV